MMKMREVGDSSANAQFDLRHVLSV